MKSQADRHDYKVPIKVKGATLWLKLILGDGFPAISPQLQVMSNVQHPAIQEKTFMYVGPAMQSWNPQGSHLINVVKLIEQEFNQYPPVPRKQMPGQGAGAQGGAPGQGQMAVQKEAPKAYVPEPVQLQKSILNELKKNIDTTMPEAQLESMLAEDDNEKLRTLILCEPDVEQMQNIVNKRVAKLKELAESNKQLKTELNESL